MSDGGDDSTSNLAIWRLSKNFSDWTLLVKYLLLQSSTSSSSPGDDGGSWKTETYHVHRNYLALAPRPCEYFTGIMTSENFREGATKTTEVVLHELAAKAFPKFLDFIYTGEIEINKDSFVALRWLARYFGNESLRSRLEEFKATFEPAFDDLLPLYQQAKELQDEELFDFLVGSFTKFLMVHKSCRDEDEVKQKLNRDFLRDILPKVSPHPAPSGEYDVDDEDWETFERNNAFMVQNVVPLLHFLFDARTRDAQNLWRLFNLPPVSDSPQVALRVLFAEIFLMRTETITVLHLQCLKTVESGMSWTLWAASEPLVSDLLSMRPPGEVAQRLHKLTMRLAKDEMANKRRRLS